MEERHQPLPGFTALPGWAWRRLNTAGRVAVVAVLIGLIAAGIYLAPRISKDKRERSAQEQRTLSVARAAELRRLRIDQRVHRARTSVHTVRGTTTALEFAIRRDLRARQRAGTLAPPRVKRVDCGPLPEDPRLKDDIERMKCLGVTSGIRGNAALGYEVLGAVKPAAGVVVWCKTNPAAGEKANGASLADVPLSPGCFGGLRPGEHRAAGLP